MTNTAALPCRPFRSGTQPHVGKRDRLPAWRADMRLQGADETAFLEV